MLLEIGAVWRGVLAQQTAIKRSERCVLAQQTAVESERRLTALRVRPSQRHNAVAAVTSDIRARSKSKIKSKSRGGRSK